MKIDCAYTENYLKERARMSNSCSEGTCINCPLLSLLNSKNMSCNEYESKYPSKMIDFVQKWSDEHQIKTYKEDFFEKFPAAERNAEGYPNFHPGYFYGYSHFDETMSTNECWDMVMLTEI